MSEIQLVMVNEVSYIYKKEVDWSVLQQGLTIPISLQIRFQELIKQNLPRGTTISIKIVIDGEYLDAKLTNQKFDEKKYPNHKDIVQIRYEPKSLIAQKMREIFKTTYLHSFDFKKGENSLNYKKRQIPIEDTKKEYLLLYTTPLQNTFLAEYITQADTQFINTKLANLDEEEFELSVNYFQKDDTAKMIERMQLTKIRKLNKSICDNLKELYRFRCQITGENFCEDYGTSVVEAHHIDYFTASFNNNSDNILIVSPNYHRLIHKLNPTFDRKNLCFLFPNGLSEKIKLNLHL